MDDIVNLEDLGEMAREEELEEWSNYFPKVLQPCIYIEHCFDCDKHNWHVNGHTAEKYEGRAKELKAAIVRDVPYFGEIVDGKEVILINKFCSSLGVKKLVRFGGKLIREYVPTRDMKQVSDRVHRWQEQNGELYYPDFFFTGYPVPPFSFEVYFMGVKLYSKLESKQWPDNRLLAAKIQRALDDYLAGLDISHHRFQLKMPKKKKKGLLNLDSTLQKYNINESRIKVFNEKEDQFRMR